MKRLINKESNPSILTQLITRLSFRYLTIYWSRQFIFIIEWKFTIWTKNSIYHNIPSDSKTRGTHDISIPSRYRLSSISLRCVCYKSWWNGLEEQRDKRVARLVQTPIRYSVARNREGASGEARRNKIARGENGNALETDPTANCSY